MTSIARARRLLLTIAACAAATLGGAAPANAQFGFAGMGGGMGIGFDLGFRPVPSPTDFLNQHALINAQRASGPTSNNVYAGNPNSYVNRVRDNGFTPSYNVQRRRSSSAAPVSLGARDALPPTPTPVEATRTAPPLSSYFDAMLRLVWPSDAPVAGDLKPRRDTSDAASLVVLGEVDQRGRASVASATDARQKLLDYGRPALQEIRRTATPVVADTFHAFLLSLYDSLKQAAAAP